MASKEFLMKVTSTSSSTSFIVVCKLRSVSHPLPILPDLDRLAPCQPSSRPPNPPKRTREPVVEPMAEWEGTSVPEADLEYPDSTTGGVMVLEAGMEPGYGGPGGGYAKGGVIRPTVVCKDKGPCYKKKVTCPAKCFTSYSGSGKNYGGGGGGGGCTIDCKKKCTAYC
ncbi:hypothetical protein L1049_009942 [Liquidambar formosana]|uniref:Uncharacterized protein n=1 Tax=Liquidambar formosana TaxID=63359 RepID=A0AAP0NAI3_LIQFO